MGFPVYKFKKFIYIIRLYSIVKYYKVYELETLNIIEKLK